MPSAVNYVPKGYHSVSPYLIAEGAERLIDFLKQSFEAEEVERLPGPDGRIGHAEVRIGDSIIMMSDASAERQAMPCSLYIYVKDTDAAYERALKAGGTSLMEPADQFYGDRNAGVRDPSGHLWWIATHVEDVSPEEIEKRAEARANATA